MCEPLVILTVNESISAVCMLCVSINYMIFQIFKLELKWQVINSSEQWNYMGEVSRLLVASPRQGLMETFFLL